MSSPLVDTFGRVHTSLRISVTDRCNIRCFYCMPEEFVRFKPRAEILTFEEMVRFVQVAATLGIKKLRLTGGEPLVREDLPKLVRMLVDIPGIEEVALTTNGILLADQAVALKSAGLHRLNISLDTLSEETFFKISRRTGLDRVLAGIHAAKEAGFENIRLNAIAIRDLTENELLPLIQFGREHGHEMRFIEFMPLDADQHWSQNQVLTGAEMRQRVEAEIGELRPIAREDASQPATDFEFSNGPGRVGFINPISEPFCGDCNRIRLTAEGQVRNCLFSTEEWDARAILRGGGSDGNLIELLHACVAAKKPGHGIDSPEFLRPHRAMYQIGG